MRLCLLQLSDTNITGSTASNGANGGGLAADSCTVVLMDRVRMYGNSATGSGGGAYVTASGTAPGGGSTSGSGRAAVAVLAVSASNISYNHAGSSSYSGAAAAGDVGLPTGSGGGSACVLVIIHVRTFRGMGGGVRSVPFVQCNAARGVIACSICSRAVTAFMSIRGHLTLVERVQTLLGCAAAACRCAVHGRGGGGAGGAQPL